jgi:hypothetical protein
MEKLAPHPAYCIYRPRLLGLFTLPAPHRQPQNLVPRFKSLVGSSSNGVFVIDSQLYFIMLTGKHCRVHYAPNKAPRIPAPSIDRRSTKSSVDWRNTTLNTELLLRSSSVLINNNNNRRRFIWWTFCFAP